MFIAFSTLLASAQFMVTSTVIAPADSADWGIDNFTNNIGIAYKINDNMFISAQAPTADMFDNIRMGVGYSFAVCPAFFVEPNYTMNLEGDNGKFNVGLSYKF